MVQLYVRYRDAARSAWGQLLGPAPKAVADEVELSPLDPAIRTTADLVAAFDSPAGIPAARPAVRISAGDLLSPITDDARLFCQGLNYWEHAAEAAHTSRKENLFFMKASSALSGPYTDVIRPAEAELLDYEIEIGVVLRRDVLGVSDVTERNVGDFVAGVTLANDVSARDVMFGASFFQWFQGKSYRTFCPTGPVLCLFSRDEAADQLKALEIALSLNGDVRQKAVSDQMIYPPAETISQLSRLMDLHRGDLILTGTPGGVIARMTPGLLNAFLENFLDDAGRREALRKELKAGARFLEPGDQLTLTMTSNRGALDLGAQSYKIASGTARG